MKRVISELDVDKIRASGLFPEIIAEYDALLLQGERPMIYMDRSLVYVGTITDTPATPAKRED